MMTIRTDARFRLVAESSDTLSGSLDDALDHVNKAYAHFSADTLQAVALAIDATTTSRIVRIETAHARFSMVGDWDDVLAFAANDDARDAAFRTFDRYPQLVERVRVVGAEMERRFGARPDLEALGYDLRDPPVTLVVRASLDEERFWDAYDAFLDFLVERGWVSDARLGIYVTRTDADAA